jgi:hypothetical protein
MRNTNTASTPTTSRMRQEYAPATRSAGGTDWFSSITTGSTGFFFTRPSATATV